MNAECIVPVRADKRLEAERLERESRRQARRDEEMRELAIKLRRKSVYLYIQVVGLNPTSAGDNELQMNYGYLYSQLQFRANRYVTILAH